MSNQRARSSFPVLLLSLLVTALSGCVETLVPALDGGPPPGGDAGPADDAGDAGPVPDGMIVPTDVGPIPPDGGDGAVLLDSCTPMTFFADADMDGFGDPLASMSACALITGYVTNADDCDDTAMGVSPDATERCDLARVDDNCSGMANEGCACDETQTRACPGGSDVGECVAGTQTCDAAGSWGLCLGAVGMIAETCNGLDDDCDGANDGAAAATACGRPPGVVTAACPAASCTVATCSAGLSDCNATFADGCEITLGSVTHCTACGAACGWDCVSTTAGCNDAATTTAGGSAVVGSSIAAGADFTCALRVDGTVVCWGNDATGQLGDGSAGAPRTMPIQVTGLTGVTAIAAGTSHACALAGGTVRCWGDNDRGQLGNGSATTPFASPQLVVGITDAVALDAGEDFTCVVRASGRVSCWGSDTFLQLGNGVATGDQRSPVDVVNIGTSLGAAYAIALGDRHACATVRDAGTGRNRLYCWGLNASGQLGNDSTSSSSTPVEVFGSVVGYTLVAAGAQHTCAMTADPGLGGAYTVYCWGAGASGQRGDGSIVATATRPVMITLTNRPSILSAGGDHTCAHDTGHAIWCWGENGSGELGDGTTTDRTRPVHVRLASADYVAANVSAGSAHTCAVELDGTPTCWGTNMQGRLGVPSVSMTTAPTSVLAP